MAVTPRQVKTLSDRELEWLTKQLKALDREIYVRYDDSNALKINLPVDPEKRAFVHEALYRRALSEYVKNGWHVETSGHPSTGRLLRLSEIQKNTHRKSNGSAEEPLSSARETLLPTAESDVVDSIDATNEPTEGHRLKRKAANRAILVEEEVETLWGTGEEDDDEEEELLSPTTAYSHGLAVDRLEASFNELAHRTGEWSARFYQRLLEDYPEVAPLFAGADIQALQEHAAHTLVLIIESLRTPDSLDASLAALGQRCRRYGVTEEHHAMTGATLLCVIEEFSGDQWTQATQDAWEGAIDYISEAMLNGARPNPA